MSITTVNVAAIRRSLGMSQAVFARTFGLSVKTVRNWEGGDRMPPGPSRVLLTVIEHQPQAVRDALAKGLAEREGRAA